MSEDFLLLSLPACSSGSSFVICGQKSEGLAITLSPLLTMEIEQTLLQTPIGSHLIATETSLQLTDKIFLPAASSSHTIPLFRMQALDEVPSGNYKLKVTKKGYSVACITLSDKGSEGKREDTSGPALLAAISEKIPVSYQRQYILPDNPLQLRGLIASLAHTQGYDLILTTGGTGVSTRDTTPEAVFPLIERHLPGFVHAMYSLSLSKTPHAAIARSVAGILGKTLLITLPGSRKGAVENLSAILPALPHTLQKMHDSPEDCGG